MKSQQNGTNLPAYDGSGNASLPNLAGFVTLDADSHYFPIPAQADAEITTIHILTDATIAGTFTVEGTNLPAKVADVGQVDVADHNEDAGKWVQINVAAAGYAQAVGTGWTPTVLSLAKTAGAGGAMIVLLNPGFRRLRLKAAISAGGTCRVVAHGKA